MTRKKPHFSKWQSVATTRHTRLLETGPAHRFRDWPGRDLSDAATGVYTIWDGDQLLYVGQGGAHLTRQASEHAGRARAGKGLYARLDAHASGRRRQDSFCLGVCDRLVLPRLSRSDMQAVAEGSASLDAKVSAYLAERCSYRFALLEDPRLIRRVVTLVRQGSLGAGKPLLNPLRGNR